ncbi:hypothetical protein BMS3Abin12_01642 [bacterium BMS3Abin12]|nr:hypothetical protein BMS3Abin12_01642 [bacterium BMS3Abin12]GBE51530.1 hypothetical protein BMS3Bbin13_02491 [bacterium BMS3Bbin13]
MRGSRSEAIRLLAFDVRRCPVAEYFRRERLSELCGTTFFEVPASTV